MFLRDSKIDDSFGFLSHRGASGIALCVKKAFINICTGSWRKTYAKDVLISHTRSPVQSADGQNKQSVLTNGMNQNWPYQSNLGVIPRARVRLSTVSQKSSVTRRVCGLVLWAGNKIIIPNTAQSTQPTQQGSRRCPYVFYFSEISFFLRK